jgi:TolB-like protein/Tfp pilus assembly protein PilF
MPIWSYEIKEIEKLHELIKDQLPYLEKELEPLIQTSDANVIMLYSRRCLEVIITDLCECELKRPRKTDPLKGIIDKLYKEEKVPAHIITSMHGLNDLSTYGTHPKEFDPEQIKPVLINLDIIIKWYTRYKKIGEGITVQTVKEPKHEIKTSFKRGKNTLIQKHKASFILSGIILLILIVIAAIYFTNILSGDRLEKGLEKSIAVLPFRNDTPVDSNKYFINGLMEDILNNLQAIKDLRVISRTSVEQFRNTTKSISEIAKELGVNYIIEGSGQKSGNKIHLSVQLLRSRKEGHLWGRSYEEEINDATDIFRMQSQIAESIATELKAVMTPGEKQIIEKIPTSNLAAYEDYLKGSFYARNFTQQDWAIALQYFEKAIEKDPQYAPAYAGISLVWLFLREFSFATSTEANPKAIAAITKALELDSTRAEVYRALAGIKFDIYWDWKGYESLIKKAIALNPNYADAQTGYANFLFMMRRLYEAEEKALLALKLDPLNPLSKNNYAMVLLITRRYREAITQFKEVLKMVPDNAYALGCLPIAFHLAGRYDEALDEFKKYFSFTYKEFVHAFNQGYAKAGYIVALNLEADTLAAQSKTKIINPCEIAILYACAGNKEKTMEMLERAYEAHDPNTPYLMWPVFDNLHDEPRFQELARKMNVPYK